MNKSALLILSAKYCNPELQVEFGSRIPACMVPVGSKPLLDLQIEQFDGPQLQKVLVAVPSDYVGVSSNPKVEFLPVDTQSMDETFHLMTERMRTWLNGSQGSIFAELDWDFHVLNGDTLVSFKGEDPEWKPDAAYTVAEDTPFSWSRDVPESPLVFSGYLTFRAPVRDPLETQFSTHSEYLKQLDRQVVESWYDFGHLYTYYRSKRAWMTTRHFNKTKKTKQGLIAKTGKRDKMEAEYHWYTNLPQELRIYCPQVAGKSSPIAGYAMEYLPMPSLAELMVYGDHGDQYWKTVTKKLVAVLKNFRDADASDIRMRNDGLFLAKSRQRVNTLANRYRTHAMDMIESLGEELYPTNSVIHGDLCFSNILYDMRSDALKLIDPRGMDSNNQPTIWGNPLYDLAKLYHSAHGGYDFILADRSPNMRQAKALMSMTHEIEVYVRGGYGDQGVRALKCLTGILFYSMLPLHIDNAKRVQALLDQAEFYYHDWKTNT